MTDYKLTLQDCFKYPEAPIQFINNDNIIRKGYIRAIEIHSDTELEIETLPLAIYHKNVSDCKLILRDRNDMTEEENKKLNKLYHEAFKILEKPDSYHFESSKIIVDYFREIGVDVDGLLISKKAVKDETNY